MEWSVVYGAWELVRLTWHFLQCYTSSAAQSARCLLRAASGLSCSAGSSRLTWQACESMCTVFCTRAAAACNCALTFAGQACHAVCSMMFLGLVQPAAGIWEVQAAQQCVNFRRRITIASCGVLLVRTWHASRCRRDGTVQAYCWKAVLWYCATL